MFDKPTLRKIISKEFEKAAPCDATLESFTFSFLLVQARRRGELHEARFARLVALEHGGIV